MNGKSRCKALKEIRQKIAQENGIHLETPECDFKGECPGTCPQCESEVRFIERELIKRSQLGKVITLTGLTLTLASCNPLTQKPFIEPEVRGKFPAREEIIEIDEEKPQQENSNNESEVRTNATEERREEEDTEK